MHFYGGKRIISITWDDVIIRNHCCSSSSIVIELSQNRRFNAPRYIFSFDINVIVISSSSPFPFRHEKPNVAGHFSINADDRLQRHGGELGSSRARMLRLRGGRTRFSWNERTDDKMNDGKSC